MCCSTAQRPVCAPPPSLPLSLQTHPTTYLCLRPCKLGDVVMIAAMVNRTFSSSMEVGVRVEAEEMATGLRRHCCSAYLTFVSLKAKQQQQQRCVLSRVEPHTSEQQRIYAQAEARRQQRLAARQAAKEDPHKAALLKACRLRPVTHRCVCVCMCVYVCGLGRRVCRTSATANSMAENRDQEASWRCCHQTHILLGPVHPSPIGCGHHHHHHHVAGRAGPHCPHPSC